MGPVKKHFEEIEAYDENLIEDLTANDAVILVAVCSAKETTDLERDPVDDTKRIVALTQDHSLFLDLSNGGIELSVNKFMNMVKAADTAKYAMAAAKILNPEQKETAFTWSSLILIPDGVLTEARKDVLDKYAMILNIDKKVAQKIILQSSQAS